MASKSAAEELDQLHKKALALFEAGQREQAMQKASELLRAAKSHLGDRHPAVEHALVLLGDMKQACGEPEEAELMYREALALRRFHVGARDPALISGLNRLAAINLSLDRHEVAEPLIRESLDICREIPDAKTVYLAIPLMNLARVHLAADRVADAASCVEEALLYTGEPDAEAEVRNVHADARLLLAEIQQRSFDLSDAVNQARSALDIKQAIFGEGNAEVVNTRTRLASFLREIDEFPEADRLALAAIEATRASTGEFSEEFVRGVHILADLRWKSGHRQDAIRLLGSYSRLCEFLYEGTPLAGFMWRIESAEVHASGNFHEEACRLYSEAQKILSDSDATFAPTMIRTLLLNSLQLGLVGRWQEALDASERSLGLMEKSGAGVSQEGIQHCRLVKATCLFQLNRFEEAEQCCRELNLSKPVFQVQFATILASRGKLVEAEQICSRYLEQYEKTRAESSGVFDVRLLLASLQSRQGRLAQAGETLREAYLQSRLHALRCIRSPLFALDDDYDDFFALVRAAVHVAGAGQGPADLPECIALASWRARVIAGPSDLELAARESPEHAGFVQQLISLDRDLEAALSAQDDEAAATVSDRVLSIRAQMKSLTAQLCEAVPGFAARHLAWNATPADLRGALGEATLVQFLLVDQVLPDRPADSRERYGPRQFHAVIIPFDGPGVVINLGPAEDMNDLVNRWRKGSDIALQEAPRLADLSRHLRGSTLCISAEGSLADFPFEEIPMPDGLTWGCRFSVRRLAGAGSLLMRRNSPVPSAASEPVNLSSPALSPIAADKAAEPPLRFPEKPTWWRKLLGKVGLRKPTDLPRQQVRLELTAFEGASSATLMNLRQTPRPPDSAPDPAMSMKRATGEAASVRTMLELRSPAWLHLSCPWSLLADINLDPNLQIPQTLHRLALIRPECTAWESPYRRGALFLSMHRSTEPGEVHSFAGCLPSWSIAKLDLQQTQAVVLACPPQLPESGFTSDAQFAMLDSFFSAGARAVIMPHAWASNDATSRRISAFYEAMKTGVSVRDAWRTSRQRLLDAGQSARVLSAAFLAEP